MLSVNFARCNHNNNTKLNGKSDRVMNVVRCHKKLLQQHILYKMFCSKDTAQIKSSAESARTKEVRSAQA